MTWQVTRGVMTRRRPPIRVIKAAHAPAVCICTDVNSRQEVDVNPRPTVVTVALLVKITSTVGGQTDVNSRRREKARTHRSCISHY